MNPDKLIISKTCEAVKAVYGAEVAPETIQVQATRKEFEGDLTVVTFPLLKISRKAPDVTATEIGEWLKGNCPEVESCNVIKGFLNIKLSSSYWNGVFARIAATEDYGQHAPSGRTVMVEFSSPNTNKPLHLGHIRNNLLGWSVSRLLQAAGHNVLKVNLVNDRGIHICKSMLAWLKQGNGVTPESSGIKGDHLVGDYYVEFNKMLTDEIAAIMAEKGCDKETAEKEATCLKEAQQMLFKWEQGDPEVRELWKKMNGWVYDGFDVTYKNLGISFDRIYY